MLLSTPSTFSPLEISNYIFSSSPSLNYARMSRVHRALADAEDFSEGQGEET